MLASQASAPRLPLWALFLLVAALGACASTRGDLRGDDIPREVRPAIGVQPGLDRPIPGEETGRFQRVVLLQINDLHGHLDPHTLRAKGGQAKVRVGGAEALAAYVTRVRERYPGRVVLVDGGDMFQGTQLVNHFKGKPVIELYNHLRVDAAAIGNHEFDYGPEGRAATVATEGEDPVGALKARIAEAQFPILSANVYERRSGEPVAWTQPTTLRTLDLGGGQTVRVGIIGLTTPETATKTRVENVAALRFGDMITEASVHARALRAQGADLVVITAHAGGKCHRASAQGVEFDPRDLSSCEDHHEIFTLARELPPGAVDVIAAGHTHARVSHFVQGVAVVESYALGRAMGRVDLFWDREHQRFDRSRTQIREPITLCHQFFRSSGDCAVDHPGRRGPLEPARYLGAPITFDPAVTALLEPYRRVVDAIGRRWLATSEVDLPQPTGSRASTTLGRLIADALLAAVPGADVAAYNGGGIRGPIAAGPIRYRDVYEAIPFENYVEVIELRGRDLELLAHLGARGGKDRGGFQFAGLRIVITPDRFDARPMDLDGDGQTAEWETTRLLSVRLADGSRIDPDGRYRVVINDFLGGGGDRMAALVARRLNPERRIQHHRTVRDAVADHLEQIEVVTADSFADDGRVRYAKQPR